MNVLPESWPGWIAAAIALFWFVGAYNRIVRLRSAALQAYAALDAALVRQIDYVTASTAEAPEDLEHPPGRYSNASLLAAVGQLTTLLSATRLRPLDPTGIAALGTALHVFLAAWEGLHPGEVVSFGADGTLSRPASLGDREEPVGMPLPLAWPEPSALAEIARGQFNLAVTQYNQAIAQFPALLVAWIMQLRPAAPLR
jgi:LemA protein